MDIWVAASRKERAPGFFAICPDVPDGIAYSNPRIATELRRGRADRGKPLGDEWVARVTVADADAPSVSQVTPSGRATLAVALEEAQCSPDFDADAFFDAVPTDANASATVLKRTEDVIAQGVCRGIRPDKADAIKARRGLNNRVTR